MRSFSFNFKSFRSISSSHADSSGISESSNSSQTPPPTLEDDESLASSISANKIRAAGRLGSLLSESLSPIDPTDIAGRTDLADHKIEQTDPLTGIRLRRASCRRSSHKRHSEQGQAPIYPVSPERTDARQADLIAELLDFWTEDQDRLVGPYDFSFKGDSSDQKRNTMDPSKLAPGNFDRSHKERQIKDAEDMHHKLVHIAERRGLTVPPYDLLELIGKGANGRVYKGKNQNTGEIVAVKIVFADDDDFHNAVLDKDNTIDSFRKEVAVLQKLMDCNAKNIMALHDAFDWHDQLWIVSDYCTGGSIRTLSRAHLPSRPGFEERHIIPIARELAIAIKSVHDHDIIHRDIKGANVFVTEEGDIKLGDFGVTGLVGDGLKRRTMVGTPHYMSAVLHTDDPSTMNLTLDAYGKEVDIWAYGITIYEAATCQVPYQTVRPEYLKHYVVNPPRLEGGDFSDGLRDLIAFCLNGDPDQRPSIEDVLAHPYIANTSETHPTRTLVELIDRYTVWERKGGQRHSLWGKEGAAPPVVPEEDDSQAVDNNLTDWRFSTSEDFDVAFDRRYSQMVATQDFATQHFDAPAGSGLLPLDTRGLTPLERFQELSANRGERSLDRLFNKEKTPYELHTPIDDVGGPSDLPLRRMAAAAPLRESLIDLDSAGNLDMNAPMLNLDFSDMPTLRAARTSRAIKSSDEEESEYSYRSLDEKRATMDWKFPVQETTKRATMDWTFPRSQPTEPNEPGVSMHLPPVGSEPVPPAFRPTLKHTATEPIGHVGDYMHPPHSIMPASSSPIRDSTHSMIDLDLGFVDPTDIVRPSTASSASGSTMTDMTSGNPFDLEEDPEQNERDRIRFSHHKQGRYEARRSKRSRNDDMLMHSRSNSMASTDSELDRMVRMEADDDPNLGYNFSSKVLDSERPQLATGIPDFDMSHWPEYEPNSGLDEHPAWKTWSERVYPEDALFRDKTGRTHRFLSREPSRERVALPEVEFPELTPPHPAAMLEEADIDLKVSELDRLLDDLGLSIKATTKALRQHADLNKEETLSETDSGFDSSAGPTGDEDDT